MNEWLPIIKDIGLGGGVVVGILLALKAFKNGSVCPAQSVLEEHRDELVKSRVVREGLIEAVNRNTAASERLTNVLVKVLVKDSGRVLKEEG